MAQNIFKIYDGRKNFWQWDSNQKLIVLDDAITQVHFSNKNMKHSIERDVYEYNGERLVNVPDALLQVAVNLVAHAYIKNGKSRSTRSSVTFSVTERPIPFNDGDHDDNSEIVAEILSKIEALHDSKADDIYYDEAGKYVQLVANGEPIGNRVELPDGNVCSIVECKINDDGHLVVTLSDGRVIDAGYVGKVDGVTFVPQISDDLILSWTNNGGLKNPDPVDLNPHDNWAEIDGVESSSDYLWEPL